YKVAENFRVLEALAPGRMDLGLGRAPGGWPLATRALQEGKPFGFDRYPQQLDDVMGYLRDEGDAAGRYPGLRASPQVETVPEVWLLGSSDESAYLAAERGVGFAFAQFINGDEATGIAAMRAYRQHFRPSVWGDKPRGMVAVFVVCANTQAEAERLAASHDLSLLLLLKGEMPAGVPSVERALTYPYSETDRILMAENRRRMVVGDVAGVRQRLLELCAVYEVEEIMVATTVHDQSARVRSFALVAQALSGANMFP
ncbi:MAG: MsnO8 family LLM class oxidoreductase, partial [Alicyclobacillus sp.]|nr:MsnO8 family LLM class oxidoreductase [Alicyclobacillus sp.]